MGQLNRPQLPEGPLKRLNDELHELHRAALRPSIRKMALGVSATGGESVSSETIRRAFSTPKVPVERVLLGIVDHLIKATRQSIRPPLDETLDKFSRLVEEARSESVSGAPALPSQTELAVTEPDRRVPRVLLRAIESNYGLTDFEQLIETDDPEVAGEISELVDDMLADAAEIGELRRKLEGGDAYAGQLLAELYAEQGDHEELQELASDDESPAQPHAQYQLMLSYWNDHPRGTPPIQPPDERIFRRFTRHSDQPLVQGSEGLDE